MEVEKSKAVVVKKFGGYDSLEVKDFVLPPLEGNIEVKVEYGGINFADLYTRKGLMEKKLPFVLGMECTGTVTAVGATDTNIKIGQKVICYDYNGGLYRTVIRVPPKNCFILPDEINSDIGASLFVNYLTAYFAMFRVCNLNENEKILIMSCAGGVGFAATQLAKTVKNVKVFGSGSSFKEKDARENGVDEFFPNESFKHLIKDLKFDLIICSDSGEMFGYLQTLLAPLGRIVIIGANNIIQNEQKLSMMTLLKLWWTTKDVRAESLILNNQSIGGLHLGLLMEKSPEKINDALAYIYSLLKEGKIRPKIHSVWPMDSIVEATKLLADRKNIGKVLIKMNENL